MSRGQSAAVYLVSVPVFFILDMVWLGVVASSFYRNHLGALMGPVNWPVALAFYLLFLAGLCIFVIFPAIEARSLSKALLLGGLFGLVTYATYDLTNWATLRGWPMIVVPVDLLWGTALSAGVSAVTFGIATRFIVR